MVPYFLIVFSVHITGTALDSSYIIFLYRFFFASGVGSPLYPKFLHYYTMILQRIRIIEGDAGFKPGTSAPEVWCVTNEPPHL